MEDIVFKKKKYFMMSLKSVDSKIKMKFNFKEHNQKMKINKQMLKSFNRTINYLYHKRNMIKIIAKYKKIKNQNSSRNLYIKGILMNQI